MWVEGFLISLEERGKKGFDHPGQVGSRMKQSEAFVKLFPRAGILNQPDKYLQ